MKTLPACLLSGVLAVASAAAADLSFSVGYGTARLNAGQVWRPALLPKDVSDSVSVFRLSLGYDLSDRIEFEGSYLGYSELSTILPLDPNVQTAVAPNQRFRCKVQALVLGPAFKWRPAEGWQIKAGAGGVLSNLSETFDGGGEGVQIYKTSANPGWFGSFGASYALSQQVSAGASLRYFDFNRKTFSSDSLTALQADVFLSLHF